jgi:hypothetical protein
MTAVYLGAFLFGAVVLAGTWMVGADKAADPHHGDPASHAAGWLPFVSLRFWTFGASTFGLTGGLVSLLPVAEPVPAVLATAVGVAIGAVAASAFRWVGRDVVTSSPSLARFVGEQARVVVAVRPGRSGRVALLTDAGRFELPAVSADPAALEHGDTVLIADVRHGVADVTRLRTAATAGPVSIAEDSERSG